MRLTTQPRTRTSAPNKTTRVLVEKERPDWRAVILAIIAAWTVIDPYLSLRYGGAIAALVALTVGSGYRPGRSDTLAVAFFSLAAASYFWAENPQHTFEAIKNQFGALGLFLGVRAVGTSRRSLRVIGLGFLSGGVLSVYMLWEVRRNVAPSIEQSLDANRIAVEGINQNYTAYSLAIGAAVLLLLWRTSVRKSRLTLLIGLVLIAAGINFTGTRGAMLALALLLAWAAAYRLRPSLAFKALIIAGVLALVVVAAGVVDELMRPTRVPGRETGDLNGRLTIWPYAREHIAERPVLGWGLGAFRILNPYNVVAHNLVLELSVGLGMVGLLLFAALIHSAIIRDTRTLAVDVRGRILTVGAIIVASLPIYLSGHWEQSAAAWVVIAIFSRSSLLLIDVRRHALMDSLRRGNVA